MADFFPPRRMPDPVDRLTDRQREVIELMSRPGRKRSIIKTAMELGISEQTVKNHLSTSYKILGVHSLGQAVRLIMERREEE